MNLIKKYPKLAGLIGTGVTVIAGYYGGPPAVAAVDVLLKALFGG